MNRLKNVLAGLGMSLLGACTNPTESPHSPNNESQVICHEIQTKIKETSKESCQKKLSTCTSKNEENKRKITDAIAAHEEEISRLSNEKQTKCTDPSKTAYCNNLTRAIVELTNDLTILQNLRPYDCNQIVEACRSKIEQIIIGRIVKAQKHAHCLEK